MARVVVSGRRAVTDPLKLSQPLGGVLALLGVARCMPLLHGAQGCSAFAKALLTRHFREPIPLQTSALTEVATVLGTAQHLVTALDTVTERTDPDVIGVLTTGITEISGEDLAGVLATRRDAGGPLVVAAHTPDFTGGLSDGWSAALRALVTAVTGPGHRTGPDAGPGDAAAPGTGTGPRDPELVAVLAGASLTAADLDEAADLVAAFGLRPLLVPDLSRSLDGHLAPDWSPLTTGGTTLAELRQLPAAGTVLSLGASAAAAATALAGASGAAYHHVDHLGGLAGADALVAALAAQAGRAPAQRLRHWRSRLADALLDCHFVLGAARVAVAGEPEFVAGVTALLAEAGAEVVAAVAATAAPGLSRVPCPEVVVGDLADLEELAGGAGAELVVASSHAADLAARIGAAHLTAGFPAHHRLGAQLQGTCGYRGSAQLLFEAANRLLEHRSARRGGRPTGHAGRPTGHAGG